MDLQESIDFMTYNASLDVDMRRLYDQILEKHMSSTPPFGVTKARVSISTAVERAV